MPFIILVVICCYIPSWFAGQTGEVICLLTWVIGSVCLGQFASETWSGKACNWFWAFFGLFIAIFTVSNHFSSKD